MTCIIIDDKAKRFEFTLFSQHARRNRRPRKDNRAGMSMMTKRKMDIPPIQKPGAGDAAFPASCSICQARFPNQEAVVLHMKAHVRLHCRFCGKGYKDRRSLSDHEAKHQGLFKFLCPLCQKGFNHKGDYNKHVATHARQKGLQ